MVKNNPPTGERATSDLGDALRSRRNELGLTMQFVADHAGLSVGFISQVERGLTSPSLASLASLAEVLKTDITSFLKQPPTTGQTTHEVNRLAYSVSGAGVSYERLSTSFPESKLHSVIVHAPPAHRIEPMSHRGEEMFYITDGEITIEIEGEAEILRKGDSIHFDSRRVHSIWNHSTRNATLLWCGTMDIFGDAPAPIHREAASTEAAEKATGDSTND